MANFPAASKHSLLWANLSWGGYKRKNASRKSYATSTSRSEFPEYSFPPVDGTPIKDEVDRRIATAFDRAKIPVVLLDRCVDPYPRRSRYDLVGIDNRRTGYVATEHLLKAGAKRIAFLGKRFSAGTVDARIAGYRRALFAHPAVRNMDMVTHGDPSDEDLASAPVLRTQKPDAFVCTNDHTGGDDQLPTLIKLNRQIPKEFALVGSMTSSAQVCFRYR